MAITFAQWLSNISAAYGVREDQISVTETTEEYSAVFVIPKFNPDNPGNPLTDTAQLTIDKTEIIP